MRPTLFLFLLVLLIPGCKKKTDPAPDYNCNCQPYGKNMLSLFIPKATALFPYENDQRRWGFIDQTGTVVISPSYAGAWGFSNNRAMIIDDTNGIQFAGFIDATGARVVSAKFRLVTDAYYSSEGLIPMGDVKKWLFGYIDMTGQVRVPFIYAYGSNFHDGFAAVILGNKVGAIDVNGNVVIPIIYDEISLFSEGLAFAYKQGQKRGYITPSNEYKFQGDYLQGSVFMYGRAPVEDQDSRLIGFIDTTGQYVIPPVYTAVNIFSEGLAAVRFDNKWGFINTSGKTVIKPQFDDVAAGFCNGLAPVGKNGQWGYINRSGSFVITPQFDDADIFYCDLARVWYLDGTEGYVNKSGEVVYHSRYKVKEKSNKSKIASAISKFSIRSSKNQ
ncbi:MAG: WG repeat-containing protein [Bacteroidales bacterium]|nr:WG repeat-containing protein [Bacteroidales bacterium]